MLRQYGIAAPSSIVESRHAEDRQPNEQLAGRNRNLPPAVLKAPRFEHSPGSGRGGRETQVARRGSWKGTRKPSGRHIDSSSRSSSSASRDSAEPVQTHRNRVPYHRGSDRRSGSHNQPRNSGHPRPSQDLSVDSGLTFAYPSPIPAPAPAPAAPSQPWQLGYRSPTPKLPSEPLKRRRLYHDSPDSRFPSSLTLDAPQRASSLSMASQPVSSSPASRRMQSESFDVPSVSRSTQKSAGNGEGSSTPKALGKRKAEEPIPRVKAEAVKKEVKDEPLSPSPPPVRSLITHRAESYALPDNCKKADPNSHKNRMMFAREKNRELNARGLKRVKAFFRDDGLVIEWESQVAVWSDTLLPPVPSKRKRQNNAVIDVDSLPDPLEVDPTRRTPGGSPLKHWTVGLTRAEIRRGGRASQLSPSPASASSSEPEVVEPPKAPRLPLPSRLSAETRAAFARSPSKVKTPATQPAQKKPEWEPQPSRTISPPPFLPHLASSHSFYATSPSPFQSAPPRRPSPEIQTDDLGVPLQVVCSLLSSRHTIYPSGSGSGSGGTQTAGLSPVDWKTPARPPFIVDSQIDGTQESDEGDEDRDSDDNGVALAHADVDDKMDGRQAYEEPDEERGQDEDEEMADAAEYAMAEQFLQRYISTFDSDRELLSGAYAPDALFSCRGASLFTSSLPAVPSVSTSTSITAHGPSAITSALQDIGAYAFSPRGEPRTTIYYDLAVLPDDVGGVLATLHSELVLPKPESDDEDEDDCDKDDEEDRVLTLDQSFVLRRSKSSADDEEEHDTDEWPLIVVSHQMVVREEPLLAVETLESELPWIAELHDDEDSGSVVDNNADEEEEEDELEEQNAVEGMVGHPFDRFGVEPTGVVAADDEDDDDDDMYV